MSTTSGGSWLSKYWQAALLYAGALVGLTVLLFARIGSMLPWLSSAEVSATSSARSFSDIAANPLFFPFKFFVVGAHMLAPNSVAWLRVSSALAAFVVVILFYLLMRKWFTNRIAFISTMLLATSSWFLTYARMATPHILLALAVIILLSCAWWLNTTSKLQWALLLSFVAVCLCLYIPGIVWIIGLVFLTQLKNVRAFSKSTPISLKMVAVGLGLLLLLPLLRAMILDINVFKEFIGWPVLFNTVSFVKEFLYVPFTLAIQSEPAPAFNLGKLPLLDIFSVAIFILGLYAYTLKFGLVRTKVLIAFGILCSILIALDNPVKIIILLPIIYATIAGGLTMLIDQWFGVFPRNPIARGIGVGLITITIVATCAYHLNRYFVAWANSPVTHATYSHQIKL